MNITLIDGLPFIQCLLTINDTQINVSKVLLDTGSASCVFKQNLFEEKDIIIQPTSSIRNLTGIGGTEEVLPYVITQISVGPFRIDQFEIEIGTMNYGFDINGIIGMDFLLTVGSTIDLNKLELTSTIIS